MLLRSVVRPNLTVATHDTPRLRVMTSAQSMGSVHQAPSIANDALRTYPVSGASSPQLRCFRIDQPRTRAMCIKVPLLAGVGKNLQDHWVFGSALDHPPFTFSRLLQQPRSGNRESLCPTVPMVPTASKPVHLGESPISLAARNCLHSRCRHRAVCAKPALNGAFSRSVADVFEWDVLRAANFGSAQIANEPPAHDWCRFSLEGLLRPNEKYQFCTSAASLTAFSR